jgi:hypothetical protein
MGRKLLLGLLLFLGCQRTVTAQSRVEVEDNVTAALVKLGMEDVAVKHEHGTWLVACSDNVYRSEGRGAVEVLRLLLEKEELQGNLHFILLEDRIEQVSFVLPKELINYYRQGIFSLRQTINAMDISCDTDEDVRRLKGVKRTNRSAGKVDIVVYPQVMLRNTWLDRMYGVMIDIAPAIEIGLWKGGTATGQVLLPLVNSMPGGKREVRPGIISLRQDWRFRNNLFGTVSIGNFGSERMGVDATLRYRTDNDRWNVFVNGGLTGYSAVEDCRWAYSSWKRVTGAAGIRYNLPWKNLQIDVAWHRYLYRDNGLRIDCSRHFGEVTIGFYALHSGGEANGGFHFAIPFPQKKRTPHKAVRVRLPEYFDWEYEAQSGPDYSRRALSRYYEIRPDENRSRGYYNPDFLRGFMMNLAEEK